MIDYDRKSGNKGKISYLQDPIVETSPQTSPNNNQNQANGKKSLRRDVNSMIEFCPANNFGDNDAEYND